MIGQMIGPYEIVAKLGEGGMGEVYKARDTRLGRTVAIKRGLAPFSDRFEREAHAIASLNHPHICSLYDVGPDYLVMEYVEGRPLTGPVTVEEALVLGRQILDALDAAHRKGIIHRDLKPANILVTKAGVKLLDFGLAKASDEVASTLSTIGGPATGAGAIVGTLQYMSPEQLEGRSVDTRSDLFAFGVVFYELITGKRAFDHPSHARLIAAILKEQPPPVSALRPLTPKSLDRIVQTCLEKDPDRRWQSAREIAHALEWSGIAAGEAATTTRALASSRSLRTWQTAAVLAAIVAVGAIAWAVRPPPTAAVPDPVRFDVEAPKGTQFEIYVALSPDGRKLAFTAMSPDRVQRVWVRDLTDATARMLPGTEGAQSAFWSPDSRFIAFGSRSQLKRVDVSGGPPQTLCQVDWLVGSGAWSPQGMILFGSRGTGGLSAVPESGGTATPITSPIGGFSSFPSFLPDGRRFLYFRAGASAGIYAGSIDLPPDKQPTARVLATNTGAAYFSKSDGSGSYLLFLREGTLLAQPFDVEAMALTGNPIAIDRVANINQYPVFSASRSGALAFRTGGPTAVRRLTWFDREGKRLGTIGESASFDHLALSPDGTRAAYRDGPATVDGDVWIMDLVRGVSARFTIDRAPGGFPVWSPDGEQIAYRMGSQLFLKAANGAGEAEPLYSPAPSGSPGSWTRDGRYLLFSTVGPTTSSDILALPLAGARQPAAVIGTGAAESQPKLSPDGHWLAYVSNESGRPEVYIRSFVTPGTAEPRTGGKWVISREGGSAPVWRGDGRELLFRDPINGSPVAVDVTLAPAKVTVGMPKLLFHTPPVPWAVTKDGARFLVAMPPEEYEQAPITVVLNWERLLER
jgi:Tol biopolymer transport system component/predicted Ser/Thr protein kinase